MKRANDLSLTNESVAKGLRRVVRKELRAAIDQLGSADLSSKAIHDVRKRIKKARAVLRLVGDDIDAGRAQERLRRASRLLAPLRDAEAVLVSAQDLCAHERGQLSARTCSALSQLLTHERARLTGVARLGRVKTRAKRALRFVERSANHWDWGEVGFRVLAAAIRRSYKQAQRGMRKARRRDRSETFHEWRKRVQTLWYALRLLEGRMPALRGRLSDLEQLETWLGEDHNLQLLMPQGTVKRERPSHPPESARLRAFAERRQHDLRRRALTLGARLFSASANECAWELRQMWNKKHVRGRRRPNKKTASPGLV